MRGKGFEPSNPLRNRISDLEILSPAHLARLCYPRRYITSLLDTGLTIFKKLSLYSSGFSFLELVSSILSLISFFSSCADSSTFCR